MSIVDFDQTKLTRLSLKSVPLAFSLTPRASQKRQSIPKCRDLIRWYRPRTDDAQPTHAQKLVIRPNRAARPMRNSICGEDVRGARGCVPPEVDLDQSVENKFWILAKRQERSIRVISSRA